MTKLYLFLRDRRAVIIQADGEKQAAQKIVEATEILNREEGAMTLRMLRTISESSRQQSNTILFPIPMDLKNIFSSAMSANTAKSEARK